MTEATLVDVCASSGVDVAPFRQIVLYGPPALYQEALKCFLENRVAQSAVVQATDEHALLGTPAADLIFVDVDLEYVSDARLAELETTVQRVAPRPVLLISGPMQPNVLQRLLHAGVAGVVLKSSGCETLLEAINSIFAGKVWLQRDLLLETFGESSHVRRVCSEGHRIEQLTQREREIISVASCGLTNRQVAARLHISEATVRHHLSSVFGKLGVANRGELIIFAYRHGLTDETDRQQLC